MYSTVQFVCNLRYLRVYVLHWYKLATTNKIFRDLTNALSPSVSNQIMQYNYNTYVLLLKILLSLLGLKCI